MPPRKRAVPSLPVPRPDTNPPEPSADELDAFVRGRRVRTKPFLYEPSAEELREMFGPDGERPVNAHEAPDERSDAQRAPGERSRGAQGALVTRAGGRVVRKTTIHFRPETHAALEAHCRAEGDEVSRVVDRAVREYLARPR